MKTACEIEREFTAELKALLAKYGAELEAEDHWMGYAECGEDVRMTVTIESKWDEHGEQQSEFVEIDLGTVVRGGGASKFVREAERKIAARSSAERNLDGTLRNFMPRVDGKPFRCKCGCNVFHKPVSKNKQLFECNSCGDRYNGI
jgi:hypothetical protein